MTIDRDVVVGRLALMRELLTDLDLIGEPDAAALMQDRLRRHAVERILGQLVDLAVSVNTHVVAARTAAAPLTYRESFFAMAQLGLLPQELAGRLAPAAGLRNVLQHEYVSIDLQLVADAVPLARRDFGEYIEAVARAVLGDRC